MNKQAGLDPIDLEVEAVQRFLQVVFFTLFVEVEVDVVLRQANDVGDPQRTQHDVELLQDRYRGERLVLLFLGG